MQDLFADIRPYNDDEVAAVLARLANSKELQKALFGYLYPQLPKWLFPIFAPFLLASIKKSLATIKTVDQFQLWLVSLLEVMLKKSTTAIEVRGLEQLDPSQSYLWLSNHRDIAMDPLLINYSLYQHGWPTSRIAIGDNLLKHADVADIMRLNKSFIVKRDITNKREKLAELKRLSAYIRASLENKHSVWIAQREGRAKNGIDKTDTAVLKMLALHGRELNEDFTTSLQRLNPVPVSIQYEWDPCDLLKAKELVAMANDGHYEKTAQEDTHSILLGITGNKGRVIVSFGQPLGSEQLVSSDVAVQAIDQQIQAMQEVFTVQQAALLLLKTEFVGYEGYAVNTNVAADVNRLKQRIAEETKEVGERLLKTYAAPLL